MKKISWFLFKLKLWSRSFFEVDSSDQFLVSYPKAGSTWIRYFLYRLLSHQRTKFETSIDAMDKAMPEFANPSLFSDWSFEETNRIVKTHQRYLPIFHRKKAALIVRDPRDIVVSYYHYLSGLRESGFDGTITDVLHDKKMGVEAFFKHFASWRDRAGLILKYEDLKDNSFEGFSQLAEFFGIVRTNDEIRTAIEAADFTNMRAAQEKSAQLKAEFKEGHQFVRSGKKAQWRDLFNSEDIAYYEALKLKYKFDLYD